METIILDDGIEYAIIKDMEINEITYTLFANVDDNSDICFRKTIIDKDGDECYISLENEEEFNLVTMHFSKDMLK